MNKLENLRKKILYRASYRGTKEMDLLLRSFVKYNIDLFDIDQLNELQVFLDFEDEVISNFYYNNILTEELKKNKIIDIFKKFKL
jgi:antitoxin CptB